MRENMNGQNKLGKQRLRRVMSVPRGANGARFPRICRRRARSSDYFDLWTYDGTMESIRHALYVRDREQIGREASAPAAIIDSHPSTSLRMKM
jgi:hypothetical protein